MKMPHIIASAEIGRLSQLAGVSHFAEWGRQLENEPDQIRERIEGNVETAWTNCLPLWLALGRVRDLSFSIRIPKYWPSFANNLGLAFADKFWDKHNFLVDVLQQSPVDSHEYLIAIDLLDFIARYDDPKLKDMRETLFAIDLPLSPVIQLETAGNFTFDGVATIGEFLRRSYGHFNGNDVD